MSGSTAGFGDLPAALAGADLVISCTGATGLVITAGMVAEALRLRSGAGGEAAARPLVMLDLALPHDVDRAAAGLPGVSVLGLDSLEAAGLAVAVTQADDVAAVRAIVAEELAARISARHAARVSPTVIALRAKAAEVVEAELDRLNGKLGPLDERAKAEISRAMQRVVGKLLHAPTVRVKELAGSPGGDSYEAALRVLFDLDQDAIDSVTRADADLTLVPARGRLAGRRQVRPARAEHGCTPGARGAAAARAARSEPDGHGPVRGRGQPDHRADRGRGRTGRADLVRRRQPGRADADRGTGVFVSALRECLLAGDIDLAVHSLKDLPTASVPGIALAAVPVRDDPRDALVARDGAKLADLPAGALIGTGSPRRAAQLRLMRPDVRPVPVRGNAGTRLAKVTSGELDAVVLACAGLDRIGQLDVITEVFEPDEMIPAAGQGALAVECRDTDQELAGLLGLRGRPGQPRRQRPRNGPCWPGCRPAATRRSAPTL